MPQKGKDFVVGYTWLRGETTINKYSYGNHESIEKLTSFALPTGRISDSRTWGKTQPIGGGSLQPKVSKACQHRNLRIFRHYCTNGTIINTF
jgi:hypothetical protein